MNIQFKPVRLLIGLLLSLGALAQGSHAGAQDAFQGNPNLPARSSRHALIIIVSRYANPATAELPGARIDKQSATQIAQAMQVPTENIHYLQDEQATGDGIRLALQQLTQRVQEGDRVYIHFSGHGTRNPDPVAGGCVEALLAHDAGSGGVITNRELATRLSALTAKTDKLFVMIDACHSGGVVQAAATRTRSALNDEAGILRPRSANISLDCAMPVNIKTRSLATETRASGVLSQDIIHVSASRDNEISFDDERKGGLATQFVRDCMLRDAQDLDNSGAVSMEEIRQCAQDKLDQRLAKDPNFKPHHLVLNGNAAFVPAWFGQASLPAQRLEPQQLTGDQALRQLFDQRDAKRQVKAALGQDKLKIGRDALDLVVQSERSGYVYLALAGSDNKSVNLLFPNDLDSNNRILAGQALTLPRPNWRVKASGPAGSNSLLVLVTDAPRDLGALAQNKAGPFIRSLNDARGRAQLGALMTASRWGTEPVCSKTSKTRPADLCSDAFGAAIVTVEEIH